MDCAIPPLTGIHNLSSFGIEDYKLFHPDANKAKKNRIKQNMIDECRQWNKIDRYNVLLIERFNQNRLSLMSTTTRKF